MSYIEKAAYYIIKDINKDIHVASFYDINGNYLSTKNLEISEYCSKKIERLDKLLDVKYKNKIVLHKIILDCNFFGSYTLKYCDKNNNIILEKDYPNSIGNTKDIIIQYTINLPDANIFDHNCLKTNNIDIVNNINNNYFCVIF